MILARSAAELPPGPSVLVPTMGALHAGHLALIRFGAEEAGRRGLAGGCVVSVFVNPTQFNDPTDFERYPRMLEHDAGACAAAGAACVFAPEEAEVYPPGSAEPASPLPAEATEPRLEDTARPGHFAGVCRVVRRLFELARPAAAVFGEKDWQQLRVVARVAERLAADGGPRVEVVGRPTVRDADGLALSSRNVFLSAEDRARAMALPAALAAARREPTPEAAESAMRRVLAGAGVTPDYAAVRDAATLGPITPGGGRPGRALVAGPVGPVRLLDNGPWP